MTVFDYLQKYKKAVVGAVTLAITVGGPYFDILQSSDLSTADGVVKAVLAVLGVAGIVSARNVEK